MIWIALGSNLPSRYGPPPITLHAALGALEVLGIPPVATSRFFENPAWPDSRDPVFVNAVAQVETALSPEGLLDCLHVVEAQFGRTRSERNRPRTLDLDILDYNGLVRAGPPELPHPRMEERGFVLVPLAEIAPGWRHPISGRNVNDLIAELPPESRLVRAMEDSLPYKNSRNSG